MTVTGEIAEIKETAEINETAETSETTAIDPGSAFLMQVLDPANRANPYPLFASMRESHPILDSGIGLWFAFTYESTHSLLRSRTTSSDERRSNEFQANLATDPRLQAFLETEPLMLFTDPPDHTRLRGLVSRAFTPRTVEKMRPRLEQLADELLDTIDGAGPIDFVEHVAYRYPVTVICELLGVPVADIPLFQTMSDDLTLTLEPGLIRSEEQQQRIDVARVDLAEYIAALLDDRRRTPGDDLVSALLDARDGEDRLSEPELINMVTLLLLAGHETTVNLLGNSLVSLLSNPDQLQLWRDNPGITRNAVDELTRYDSPVQLAMRVLIEPTEIAGELVPTGEQIITLLGSANRDPLVFDQPDRLDLARGNAAAHMSFGGGIHHCLGMALARTEAEIVLGAMVARFTTIDLVQEPETRTRIVLRGYEEILMSAS